jgi:hypothetical protein
VSCERKRDGEFGGECIDDVCVEGGERSMCDGVWQHARDVSHPWQSTETEKTGGGLDGHGRVEERSKEQSVIVGLRQSPVDFGLVEQANRCTGNDDMVSADGDLASSACELELW